MALSPASHQGLQSHCLVFVAVSAVPDFSCLWQGSWQGVGTRGAERCRAGEELLAVFGHGCRLSPPAGREAGPSRCCGCSPHPGCTAPQGARRGRASAGDTDGPSVILAWGPGVCPRPCPATSPGGRPTPSLTPAPRTQPSVRRFLRLPCVSPPRAHIRGLSRHEQTGLWGHFLWSQANASHVSP